MKHFNVPLTYAPKIDPVRNGTCRQTIRKGNKYSVGDLIRFYTWSGKPYRSKRTTITEYAPITFVENIIIKPWGFLKRDGAGGYGRWCNMDGLAEMDGIVPPTGIELRNVLQGKNGEFPQDGVAAQIVRWVPRTEALSTDEHFHRASEGRLR